MKRFTYLQKKNFMRNNLGRTFCNTGKKIRLYRSQICGNNDKIKKDNSAAASIDSQRRSVGSFEPVVSVSRVCRWGFFEERFYEMNTDFIHCFVFQKRYHFNEINN